MPEITIASKTHGICIIYFDPEDADLVAQRSWYITKRHQTFYAATHGRTPDNKKTIMYMHKLIATYAIVDHRNGNGLDNRRENLREATRHGNGQNRRKHIRATSQYKGVCWNKHDKRWRAQITLEGKNIYLGGYKDETEAALAYDTAALKHYGLYARTNF